VPQALNESWGLFYIFDHPKSIKFYFMKKVVLVLGIVFLFATCKKEIPQKQLTVNVTPEVGGSVSPSSGTYKMGSGVNLLATPSPEYIFKEWTGGLTGTTNPGNLIMDADKTVTAIFEKREYPHPRSSEALIIVAKRYGIIVGVNLAEPFCIVRLLGRKS
jgi:hypothetical protein